MKLPKGKLRSIRQQVKEKVEEGDVEKVERTREWTGEKPEKKRSIKRDIRNQVRSNGGGRVHRTRSFSFKEGDLVELWNVPHALRKDVKRGDVGMVIASAHNGERITIQIGVHIANINGTALRPLPEMEEDDE
jgi:hypothetical protein